MIRVERFINELMSSNCYLVVDDEEGRCLCIDPASQKSEQEIDYIQSHGYELDYIILTHEHTDHTWGVNALLEAFPASKVVCSELCKDALPREAQAYFQFYYDDPNYSYNIMRVDQTVEELEGSLNWGEHTVEFIVTPGHSPGSVCVVIEGMLFGGDTLMPFKPFIKKRSGGSAEKFKESISFIESRFPANTQVYPGHGEAGLLESMLKIIK